MKDKKQVFSKPFNLVYEKNYPDLFVGPGFFSNVENATKYSPREWIKQQPKKIEEERAKQIFSFKTFKKTDANKFDKSLFEIQLLAQTNSSAEIEIELENKANLINEKISGVKNFSYELENIKIIDNLKIPNVIEKTVNDGELKAKEGILNIYKKTQDVYKIEQILSLGLLGITKNRVLVPTRWAITSTDDIISKELIENKILDFPTIDKHLIFSFDFYENKFLILFVPRNWGFEQIEIKENEISKDYEINTPRKTYATEVSGGYYAARLEIANYLFLKKKQASVIVFRDIAYSYESKGVWVIREAIKEALKTKPLEFNTLFEATKYIDTNIKHGINFWLKESKLYTEIKYQKKIFDFL